MKAVAFKVTYNDGGANVGQIGYRGVCSNMMKVENIVERGVVWCSEESNACRQYLDNNFEGRAPRVNSPQDAFCYESGLFLRRPFQFGAGKYHNGPHEGKSIPMSQVESGDLAVLTTIPPGHKGHERIIIGFFRVGRVHEDDPEWGIVAESDGTMDIILPDHVAEDLRFWNYQPANKDGSLFWGSGLFRYMAPETVRDMLTDTLLRLAGTAEQDVMLAVLGPEYGPKPKQYKDGKPPGGGIGGGEGEEHRRLKMRVASDPTLVGLPKKAVAQVEYGFLSGDRVDIHFDLPDGSAAVVEIETTCPLPGAHQAIKYRVLAEVERGDDLGGGEVRAILVAYGFDQTTNELCRQYGVETYALPPA